MDEKTKAFLRLMKAAFSFAKHAYNCSFDNYETHRVEDKCSAMAYASACISKYSAAEAIYCTYPELERPEFPKLFSQFEAFAREVLSDFETGHSRQWVDIEFKRLKELFEDSVCSLPITE